MSPPSGGFVRRTGQDTGRLCTGQQDGEKKGESSMAWQPDVLRHTFATHHLATFRNYAELQLEMGHRSIELLRTRYIAIEGMYGREKSLLVG